MSFVKRALQGAINRFWWATRPGAGGALGAQASDNALREMDIEDLAQAMREALGGHSSTGVNVTPERALRNAAYWTTITVLAETVAQVPFHVKRKIQGGRGAEVAEDAPVHKLLSKRGRPNDWQTSYQFRHLLVWHLCSGGNFYGLKGFVRGELRELLPVHWTKVRPEQDDSFRLTYRVHLPRGGQRIMTRAQVFHVMGASDNGFAGLAPMAYLGEPIGLAIAQDAHAGKLFENGARLWGVLEHPGKLGPEVIEKLRSQFHDVYAGVENAHKTAILEEGMSYKQVAQSAEQAQLVESRKLQRSIVGAMRRVPPHMIGDLDKATFSNIENLARQFIDFAVMPYFENVEAACDQQLLTEEERAGGLFCKFNVDGLLRGDSLTRARVYQLHRQMGTMSPNEIREKEDLNPREDEGGDRYDNPNTTPGGQDRDPAEDPASDPEREPETEPDDEEARRNRRLALVDPAN